MPMPCRTLLASLSLCSLAACSALAPAKPFQFEHEGFDNVGTYSREIPAPAERACAAAQRALLSQGYVVTAAATRTDVVARKNFQQNTEQHVEVEFHVVCTPNADGTSTAFATALQDTFALKKTNNSASLGVSAIGSLSMPISSISDSMVKVASATIPTVSMYDRFFTLMQRYLTAFEQEDVSRSRKAGPRPAHAKAVEEPVEQPLVEPAAGP
ncbi:DUF2242 domain-containing protein [Xylophilus rhododendri]|uniref:DUF2242 domain-containing protein n=1 Tax=Xylophilus rhododendri TaxID=2697032 RepID=A0A857J440_9BURK|nr:DUF2242 domain-containing protein [Xylophilus rhododendri]QHI97625.1 DUF2242 domain-containing protein [Xylophilus rhododendri]